MSVADIITITLTAIVLLFTIVALFFSAHTYLRKKLKTKILNYLHNISDEYWSIIPKPNNFANQYNVNGINSILHRQGIHGMGLGKFIYHLEGNKWQEQMTLDGIVKILNNLSIRKLLILKKYYKKINNRIVKIKNRIVKFSFFEKTSNELFDQPVYRGYPWENTQIEYSELLLFFSDERDSGVVKSWRKNTKITNKKERQFYPSEKSFWALRFKNVNNGHDILVIFENDEIKKIKIYSNYPNLWENEFTRYIESKSKFYDFLKEVKSEESQISYLYQQIESKYINNTSAIKIINLAKTYNYIYSEWQENKKTIKKSVLNDNSEFLEISHFSNGEIRIAKFMLDQLRKNQLKSEYNISKNSWILIFLEIILEQKNI